MCCLCMHWDDDCNPRIATLADAPAKPDLEGANGGAFGSGT